MFSLVEYEAKKWLHEQHKSLKEEVRRLLIIYKLENAKKLTSTYALSMKTSDLARNLITEAYIKRFDEEIKKLGAHYIGVQLKKTGTEKGRVFHQIILKNNKLGIPSAEVLSEGEFGIVSLAAFLADVEGQAYKSTFIFDDPITSLDQRYEETTIRRLIELSQTRQVIVFTHRLSMLALLEEAAEKNKIEIKIVGLQREPWGMGEPIEAPLHSQKPKKAINTLLDRVTHARKVLIESGQSEYESLAKGICSNLRITLERLIENDLLVNVIQRYRSSIITKGKLHNLAKITINDCKYIDDLMTEYSTYEHSQSLETPTALPDPDKLEADLKGLGEWRNDFEKRSL